MKYHNFFMAFLLIILQAFQAYGNGLTPEQMQFYEQQGYVIIPFFLNKTQIDQLLEPIDRLHKRAQALSLENHSEHMPFVTITPDEKKIIDQGTQFVLGLHTPLCQIKRIVWVGSAEPTLLTAGRDKRLLLMISQILGSDSADHLINQVHFKNPGDGVHFPWHQDSKNRRSFDPNWVDINQKGSFVQTIIALNPMHEYNGSIIAIPGSHKQGDLFLEKMNPIELETIIKKQKKIKLLANPGDLILMHPHLIHKSDANHSSESRWTFINGFSYPGSNQMPYPGKGSAERIYLKE